MKNLLYQYNPWWEDDFLDSNLIVREKYFTTLQKYLTNRQIIVLTGLRRVGKTSFMKLLIKQLIDNGVNSLSILYVSLDDYQLNKYTIFDIITEFRKVNKLKIEEKVYLFLDEIASKEDFHIQLKNIYDNQNVKIFAASSSASLLKDKKASLTGRSIVVQINPLDLEEYLAFNEVTLKKRDSHLLQSYFEDYIQTGGLPENVLTPSREYLMNLLQDIIQKDIIAYYGVRNQQIVKDYFTLLMERSGKQLSINKISKILGITPDSASRYLNYFESTYLIHLLPRWGNTNQKLLSSKKIYSSDLGIKYLFNGKRDLGSYFENYIFLKLNAKKKIYYLYEKGIELDFFTEDKILIEAKYYSELTDKQAKLYHEYPSKQKIIIDSVEKLSLLDDM